MGNGVYVKKHRARQALIACGLCLAIFCTPLMAMAQVAREISPEDSDINYPIFYIEPGDLLNVFVYGDKDIPNLYLVDTQGKILFPLVGNVKVSGQTPSQASKTLTRALLRWEKKPQVTILIQQSNHYAISVIGTVKKPGTYLIEGKPTLLSALSEAGGPDDDANLADAVLIHNGVKTDVRLDRYLTDRNFHAPEPLLYPGDVLMVPRSHWPTIGEWGIIVSIVSSIASVVALSIAINRN